LTGHPDGFGSKSTLLILPAVAVLLYLVLSVVVRYPAYFNFPVQVTDRNRQPLRDLAIGMIGWLKAEVMCIFAWLTLAAISTAEGHGSGLGPAFAPVSIAVIAATIALFWYRMYQTRTSA
jgi:apolipoprotein N-acyltransferase